MSLVYPELPERWRTDLCPLGKAKEWVQSGRVDPLPSWETSIDREYHIGLFREGGSTGPLNWYKSQIRNIDGPALDTIPKDNIVLNVPVVFVGGDQDYATRIEVMHQAAELGKQGGWLPSVDVEVVAGSSHWLLMEKPSEIFAILDKVAKRNE
jgi:pimeloyl-ACP methyl ester carboxylesterase